MADPFDTVAITVFPEYIYIHRLDSALTERDSALASLQNEQKRVAQLEASIRELTTSAQNQ